MFEQLPSKYFIRKGQHMVRYSVRITEWTHVFSENLQLYPRVFGKTGVYLSQDKKTIFWEESLFKGQRATKYSSEELAYMLDVLLEWEIK